MGGGLGLAGLATMLDLASPAAGVESPAAGSARAESATAGGAPAVRGPHFAPRAKRVIQLFMNGGPFQGDFFDPKPLLNKHAGQRPAEVDFRTENATGGCMAVPYAFQPRGECGLPVSDLLPKLSGCIDDLCVIRSMHCDNPNHGPALFQMNNGTITPTRPSMGAWFLYGLGAENADLPGYVVLCPGRPVRFAELWSSAFLPGAYQGTYINHSQLDPKQMVPNVRNPKLSPDQQRRQLDLLRQLNEEHLSNHSGDAAMDARI
ncbi:MAG TPA: DUF1501 domain-containing protein, partial [Pirellulaceae bacterium]|nr:DUF1501 domain-containing protein [Pirellulaceae bacterium]